MKSRVAVLGSGSIRLDNLRDGTLDRLINLYWGRGVGSSHYSEGVCLVFVTGGGERRRRLSATPTILPLSRPPAILTTVICG